MNAMYIADHIVRVQEDWVNHPVRKEDSLKRIASQADLFGSISDFDSLPDWEERVNNFIDTFKQTEEGHYALNAIRQAREGGYRRSYATR